MSDEIERRGTEHWSFDKRINAGHLITTLTIIIAAVVVFYDLKSTVTIIDNRVGVVEQRLFVNDSLKERVVKLEVVLDRLDSTLDRLNQKLDKQH